MRRPPSRHSRSSASTDHHKTHQNSSARLSATTRQARDSRPTRHHVQVPIQPLRLLRDARRRQGHRGVRLVWATLRTRHCTRDSQARRLQGDVPRGVVHLRGVLLRVEQRGSTQSPDPVSHRVGSDIHEQSSEWTPSDIVHLQEALSLPPPLFAHDSSRKRPARTHAHKPADGSEDTTRRWSPCAQSTRIAAASVAGLVFAPLWPSARLHRPLVLTISYGI